MGIATELAYLAGVIDSDGTIGIKRSTYAMRVTKDSTQPVYSERLSVRQVQPEAVDLLQQHFGGSRYMTKPSARNGRELHTWVATDARANACLIALLPYLRIKRKQAENAIALRAVKEQSKRQRVAKGRGHVGGAHRSPELSEAMESLYLTAKSLNAVGV